MQNRKVHKRIICLILSALLLLSAGCAPKGGAEVLTDGSNAMSAAVVYDSSCSDRTWEDTLGYLTQSLVLGVSAAGVDVRGEFDLGGCDILYLDASVASSANAAAVKQQVSELVKNGARVYEVTSESKGFEEYFIERLGG